MFYRSPQKIKNELKNCYRRIARGFSDSRQKSWPEFTFFLEYIPNDCKLLDLGCGNGRFLSFLEKQDKRLDYTGVDFCPELLKIAQKRFPQQSFVEQDITRLDINNRFDRIISIAAFHHIPGKKQREKTLKMIFEHLEDNGLFLLSVWNLWQGKYLSYHFKAILSWVLSLFRNNPRDLYIPFGRAKVKRYYHAFLAFELRRLLRKNSFEIEEFRASSHNFLFVCKKKMYKPAAEALLNHKKLAKSLPSSSAVATFKKV